VSDNSVSNPANTCLQLKRLSRALTETVRRATDIVARYGGEKFVVILLDTKLEQALYPAKEEIELLPLLSMLLI